MTTAYCTACDQAQPVDAHWRVMQITGGGTLKISAPFEPRPGDYFPDSALACGQGSALVLVERFLHSGSFEAVQTVPQHQDQETVAHAR